MACEYYIGDRKFTEQEFKDHLTKEGLDFYVDSKDVNLDYFKEPIKVGMSHESLSNLSKRLGLPPIELGEVLEPEQYAEMGRRMLSEGINPNEVLNSNLEPHKKAAISRAYLEQLVKEADKIKDKSSKEYQSALDKINDFERNTVKKLGTQWAELGRALQGERDLDTDSFTAVQRRLEDVTGRQPTKEENVKIKELTEENEKLRNRAEEADKKLIEETDKNIGKKESDKTYKERAKKVADNFRKLKSKPFTFKDDKGNDVPVQIQGISWNDLVETGAKVIEKTGEIADGVSAIIEKIKDTDWYKELSDKDKGRFSSELEEHYIKQLENTPEAKNIRRLEKELENLQKGEVKNKPEKRASSEKEKELKDAIFEEKKKLGLIKSKELSDKDKAEDIETKLKNLQERFADKKGNDFTTSEAIELWDYAHRAYLDKGVSYVDAVNQVHKDTGLSIEQVSKAFDTPKTKKLSDKAWQIQYERRLGKRKVNDYIDSKNRNPYLKAWRTISSAPRSIVTALHGHVFAGTHYPMGLITPSNWDVYFNSIVKMSKAAYGSKGLYEQMAREIESDKDYTPALRFGLKSNLDDVYSDDFEKSNNLFVGKLKDLGQTGTRGFLGLKWLRLQMFKKYWNALPESDRTQESGEMLAYLMNVATGATNEKLPTVLQEGLFSAPMESARWGRLFKTPAMAAAAGVRVLDAMRKGEPLKPADKVLLKVWGSRVGQQLGMYVGALSLMTGLQNSLFPNNKINWNDPNKKDFLKPKIGNTTIDISGGVLGVASLIYSMLYYANKDKSRKQAVSDIGAKGLKYGLGKSSPLIGDIGEAVLGSDFEGNPLPWSDKKIPSGGHKLSVGEYLSSKAPIFIEGTLKNIYKGAEEQGLNKTQTEKYLNGALQFGLTAGIGLHAKESFPERPTPYTEQDKKDPIFKYFLDRGIEELPNVPLNSTPIKNYEEGTKKMVSEFSKEKQDEYIKSHKEYLKETLEKVIDKGFVYINKLKEVSLSRNSKSEPIDLSELKKEELAQVLHLAQGEATRKAKKQVFNAED